MRKFKRASALPACRLHWWRQNSLRLPSASTAVEEQLGLNQDKNGSLR